MYNQETLKKFNKDKSVKYFPGITIIQKITDPAILEMIIKIRDEYLQYSFAEKLVFLPDNSCHMTIAGLITYENLEENDWSEEMPDLQAAVSALDMHCISLLENEYRLLNEYRPLKKQVSGSTGITSSIFPSIILW